MTKALLCYSDPFFSFCVFLGGGEAKEGGFQGLGNPNWPFSVFSIGVPTNFYHFDRGTV